MICHCVFVCMCSLYLPSLMLSLKHYDNFCWLAISLHFNHLVQLTTAIHPLPQSMLPRLVYIVVKIKRKKKKCIHDYGYTIRFLFAHILRQLNLLLTCQAASFKFFFSFHFFSYLSQGNVLLIIHYVSLYENILLLCFICSSLFSLSVHTRTF